MTIYLAASGREQLDHAQAIVDRHLVECSVCAGNRPCSERRDAEAVFLRHGRLPQRRPGLAGGAAIAQASFDGFKRLVEELCTVHPVHRHGG